MQGRGEAVSQWVGVENKDAHRPIPDPAAETHASIAAHKGSACAEETMRGVVFIGGRELELMNFPDPVPGPDEVVIEMKASGMCGSDLHQYRRPKSGGESIGGLPGNPNPVIGGPEPCGVHAAIGTGVSE